MTNRIYGIMCIRNEADRYLAESIRWNMEFLDQMFVYDDGSDDSSMSIAKGHGAIVEQRSSDVPSFLEHEGKYREGAWRAFEHVICPETGDTIVALDADEFMVHYESQTRIREALFQTDGDGIKIIEVFDVRDGVPHQRIDGFWDTICSPRVFRYQPSGAFRNQSMGCGSVPTYVLPKPQSSEIAILHYGYVDPTDRQEKSERYSTHLGHNPSHVRSILQVPTLMPWRGSHPDG